MSGATAEPAEVAHSAEILPAFARFGRLVAGVEVSGLDEPGLRVLLAEVRGVQRRLDGLATRIGVRSNQLAAAGRAGPAEETARGGGAVGSRQARREAARAATAATVPGLLDALSHGEVSGEHVDVFARHTKSLSDGQRAALDFDDLIGQAGVLPVETFDRLVKRRVDTARGDHGLKDTATKQQASEFRHWFDPGTGMGRFTGSLDPERYELLTNAIEHHTTTLAAASDATITKDANLAARALVELVCRPATTSGRTGRGSGGVPSIVVIVDHDTAINGPHRGSVRQTENGHDLAAATITRLGCDAVLRRVTLDPAGVPVNVGRKYRTATDAQWAALKTLHTSCAWGGCEAPIGWCQAHHVTQWEHGGTTDLHNLVPLCSRHHHQVHEGQWRLKLLPDRALKIYRPDRTHHQTIPPPKRC